MRKKIAEQPSCRRRSDLHGGGSVEVLNLLGLPVPRPGPQCGFFRACVRDLLRWRLCGRWQLQERRRRVTAMCIDLDAIADASMRNTRIVFLDNPTNPTGTIIAARSGNAFSRACPSTSWLSPTRPTSSSSATPTILTRSSDHDGQALIVTMRTFSKIFGLAGLRVGYAVAQPDLVQLLNKVRQPFNVTSLAQAGVIAGMDDTEHVAAHARQQRRGDGVSRSASSSGWASPTCRAMPILF